MTVTYDPTDPAYFDEADYRAEATRIYDLCQGCRLCWNLCPSFESLFDIVDTKYEGNMELLNHDEQDRIVNECYQCKLCYVKCPYIPPHEWALDFPRLMMRGQAIEYRKNGGKGLGDLVLTRTDLFGKLGTTFAPIANTMMGGRNSLPRKMMQAVTGVAAARELPKYAAQRFSDWFRKYFSGKKQDRSNGSVALFPTCMVEYQNPGIGKDAARVMERNHIGCDLADGLQCCGMPHLDIGNLEAFRAQAGENARILARQVRQGKEIVALQPTCAYTLKDEYPAFLGTEAAREVAAQVSHRREIGHDEMRPRVDEELRRKSVVLGRAAAPGAAVDVNIDRGAGLRSTIYVNTFNGAAAVGMAFRRCHARADVLIQMRQAAPDVFRIGGKGTLRVDVIQLGLRIIEKDRCAAAGGAVIGILGAQFRLAPLCLTMFS